MNKISTKRIVLTGLMIAFVFLTTRFTAIPAGVGVFNIGDVMIMVTAIFLGQNSGLVAGGIGSALSDAFTPGYQFYAPITLIVKGIEGYVIGCIASSADNSKKGEMLRIIGCVAGALVMAGGYFLADTFALGLVGQNYGITTAMADLVPTNLLQGGASIVIGYTLTTSLNRLNVRNLLK